MKYQMTFEDFLAELAPEITMRQAIAIGVYSEVNGEEIGSPRQLVTIHENIDDNTWWIGQRMLRKQKNKVKRWVLLGEPLLSNGTPQNLPTTEKGDYKK